MTIAALDWQICQKLATGYNIRERPSGLTSGANYRPI